MKYPQQYYVKKIFIYFSIVFSANLVAQDANHWMPEELNSIETIDAFQKIVTAPASPIATVNDKVINIALIYPGEDVSDFWIRNSTAFTERLKELGVTYTTEIFSSRQIEHALQTLYVDKVLQQSDYFDYVIFGPSELDTQSHNIQKLSASEDFKTFIWAFHTPMKDWKNQPRAWFDFSSSVGAQQICEFLLDKFGNNVSYFMNRGIPGITDDQRSGEFKSCVTNGGWTVLYEHFGQYQQYGGYDGAQVAMQHFQSAKVIHNANTAMTVGVTEALKENQQLDNFFVTGWGGTQKELNMIRNKELNATPMRMSDDVGVASAEAIKLILDDREDEVPYIYLGRITIANDDMTDEELDQLEQEAFRYSRDLDEN